MKCNYHKLELNEEATTEQIKKAYFRKVREFPPEENPEKFIEIRKSYEEILTYNNSREYEFNLIRKYFKVMRFYINDSNEKEINEYCIRVKKIINIENFRIVSDELVDLILYSKFKGNRKLTLELTEVFLEDFKRLGLIKLSNRYLVLKKVLKERFKENGY